MTHNGTPGDSTVDASHDGDVSPDSIRAAAVVFGIAVLVALPAILYFGRRQWFFIDEWSFLAGRPFGIEGVLDNHNGHWVSTPFLLFRGLFNVFGIRSYLPYQLLATLSHLAIVVLSRATMRRLGVRPWTATFVAVFLLLLGSGAANLVFGFQVSLNGSVVCGLGALLLVDYRGPLGRRDGLALCVSLVGLTTSAVMIPFIAAIGAVTLIGRGARVAAFHVAPPALVFIAWYVAFGREGSNAGQFSLGNFVRFFVDMNRAVFLGLGEFAIAAAVLGAVAVLGVTSVWQARNSAERQGRCTLVMVVALFVSWWGFALATAAGRSDLLEISERAPYADRYLHVGAMVLMPVVALGIDRILSSSRLAAVVPAAALLVAVPANIDALANPNPFTLGREDFVEAMAASRFIDIVPPDHLVSSKSVIPEFGPLTVGWLRRAVEQGAVDPPSSPDAALALDADLRIATEQVSAREGRCDPETGEVRTTLNSGDRLFFDGDIVVTALDGEARSAPLLVQGQFGNAIDVLAGPFEVVVTGTGTGAAAVCVDRR